MTTTAKMRKKQIGKLTALVLIGASLSLPAVSMAQDGNSNHRIVHQRIKNHFDKNGDGTLSGREAIHARKFHTRWHNAHDRPDVRPHRRHPDVNRPDLRRPDIRSFDRRHLPDGRTAQVNRKR